MTLLPVQYRQNYGTADAAAERRASPNIWADCPLLAMIVDPGVGYFHADDFVAAYDLATNTAVTQLGPYEVFTGNGPSFAGGLTGAGGFQTILTGTSADVAAQMVLGGGVPFLISDTAGDDKKLWFECRFKVSSVTDADQAQFYIGLTEEDRSVAAGTFATGGGDLGFTTTIDLLGFARFDNDGDSLSLAYQKASAAAQDNQQIVIAADTFIKVGFVYDPLAPTAERIAVFKNNLKTSTWITGTNIAASTFPDGEELTMVFSAMNDSTTENTITLDWWRCAQLVSGV